MVIPTLTLNDELEEMAEFCAAGYRSQVDELIISEDGGRYSEVLRDLADIYIYSKTNEGFTKAVNNGWRISKGDYTMIVNSDTQLLSGKLTDLCLPNYVTSPNGGQDDKIMWGAFFVVPKTIKDELGVLRDEMKLYASDSEYWARIRNRYKLITSVDILHLGSKTTFTYKTREELDAISEIDSRAFDDLVKRGLAAR